MHLEPSFDYQAFIGFLVFRIYPLGFVIPLYYYFRKHLCGYPSIFLSR